MTNPEKTSAEIYRQFLTEETAAPASQPVSYAPQVTYAPGQPLRAPYGTSPYTPHAWAFVGILLLPMFGFVLFDLAAFTLASLQTPQDSAILLSPDYLFLLASTWGWLLLTILFAFLDYRALKNAGVPQPFHWAWSLLNPIAYAIGRSIIIRRRTGSGMAIMWAYLGLYALYIGVAVVKTITSVNELMQTPFS